VTRLGLGFALAAAACASEGPPPPPIVIDGSSTLHPITKQAADQFRKKHPRQEIVVGATSTGAGLKRFCAGELDLADASRPISADEQAACQKNGVAFLEVPIAYDAISVIVHPTNTWATSITVAELKQLWAPAAERKVTKWNQIRKDWPERAVHLFGPDSQSGTFDYFTEAVCGASRASRTDYEASADHGKIVAQVAADELGIGYVGYPHFEAHKDTVHAVAIDDLDDEIGSGAIAPSPLNVRRGVYRPLSRTLFLYARAASMERQEFRAFVESYARFAHEIADQAGGVRLNSRESELALARITKRVLGSMFTPPPEKGASLERVLASHQ
jgi:phosphate transport system substrate-binding protein